MHLKTQTRLWQTERERERERETERESEDAFEETGEALAKCWSHR